MIEMKPVESSQIAAIGHDPATNTLAVQFHGKEGPGSVYHYENVSAEQHDTFVNAESIGKHFGANFKKNEAHPFTRQEEQKADAAA